MPRASLQVKLMLAGISASVVALAVASTIIALRDRVAISSLFLAALFASGAAAAGSAALAHWMARSVERRARTIADAARRYRDGDFTLRRLEQGDDELGTVARALDETVENLAGRISELARDRGRMAAILAGMIEGVVVVDPQGRLQLANDAARQMLRLDDLAVGRHYIESIRHPAIKALVGAALHGETPASVQLSPPRDPSRTLSARAAPSIGGAAAHGAILVLHDITELRQADQIRRDFVANVSHELRTPLTAVRGYLEALGEPDVSAEERRRFLEIVTANTHRMERLVKDLLHLARLDAGQERIDRVAFNLRGLLHAVVADVKPSLDARRQGIDISVAPEVETAETDPAKLHDVLRNLLANASTYAPEGSRIRIDAHRSVDALRLSVADQGPGIPDRDLPRIFERFYRVDKSRRRDPGGTGLGLAIVKHLVELQGGRVLAENLPAGGACFTIDLPMT
jgi:two-component system phosphate regulon sensor histidine kinase PhoR